MHRTEKRLLTRTTRSKITATRGVAVIVVTYNSEEHIEHCMQCLVDQTYKPSQIILVDSGSRECGYLRSYLSIEGTEVVFAGQDAGFCRANNCGLKKVLPETHYVFFLNPDAFISANYIEKAVAFMEDTQNAPCGAITGIAEGYCMKTNSPTGLYDTTGIFYTRLGRWYDRGQGQPVNPDLYRNTESIPAICGALFFSRYEAIKEAMLRGGELFDERFYMYKEDIDLSLRLRENGRRLMFVPELKAYHCRGWDRNRRTMPKKMRLHSAYNELRIHRKQKRLIPILYSTLKYWAVKYLNI